MSANANAFRVAITTFNNAIHAQILEEIRAIISKASCRRIDMEEDAYCGYPVIYDENGHCTVVAFQTAYIGRNGKMFIINHDRKVLLSALSSFELLQVLELIEPDTSVTTTLPAGSALSPFRHFLVS